MQICSVVIITEKWDVVNEITVYILSHKEEDLIWLSCDVNFHCTSEMHIFFIQININSLSKCKLPFYNFISSFYSYPYRFLLPFYTSV